ncbi:MAG TPA: protein kinase, partial [Alphaproteobacteria bacterium]
MVAAAASARAPATAAEAGAGTGLAAAHDAGLVHRDFKPENVIVGKDGRVRVMDFGLARVSPDRPPSEPISIETARSSDVLITPLTQTGTVMGTPVFMSPEACRGEGSGEAGDQFSFCVALYEALYGKRPFEGENLIVLMA